MMLNFCEVVVGLWNPAEEIVDLKVEKFTDIRPSIRVLKQIRIAYLHKYAWLATRIPKVFSCIWERICQFKIFIIHF
jgi:hypothetical protein